MTVIERINEWLNQEKELGSPNPDRVVLSTATKNAIPHSRVVAIREINHDGVLFFTQKDTRKVIELHDNPAVSLTLWLPLQQRQVIVEGMAHPLTQQKNERYWKTMPHDRQLRFAAYAPTSGQSINSIDQLENQYQRLVQQYSGAEVPMSDFYRGFHVSLDVIYFYTLGSTTFSEVVRASKINGIWLEEMLSP